MSPSFKIVAVVGSLRADSINRKLVVALQKLAPASLQFEFAEIGDLPLYNQEADAQPPVPAVQRLREQIKAADGVLFATPEYNRSFPGVLKNAIDQASRPWGKNAWAGKPAAVVGASVGPMGSAMAQQHLRNVVSYLDMPTLTQSEVYLHVKEDTFQADGRIAAGSEQFLRGFIEAFAAHVARYARKG